MMTRRGGLFPCLLLGALAFAEAAAAQDCGARRAVADSRDRCRASYIQVETADGGWRTVDEKEGPMCFRAETSFWRWQCRGYEETARCRGANGATEVRVTLSNGDVRWECLE